ncbi:MAG: pentapeptide repeat-containing protein [Pleurocapsa sp. MO_192.B19]|nr:pentapeptide repeat-containing protein [Pleurocapsa sp. MO_192.B19]
MANEEQLAILNQGVEVWNKWREENPKIIPDLKGAKLRDKHLNKANFSKADIRSADFTKANLTDANFTNSKAGLQSNQFIKLLIFAFLIIVILQIISSGVGLFIANIFRLQEIKLYLPIIFSACILLSIMFVFIILGGYAKAEEASGNNPGNRRIINIYLFLSIFGVILLFLSLVFTLLEINDIVGVFATSAFLILINSIFLVIGLAGVAPMYFLSLLMTLISPSIIISTVIQFANEKNILSFTISLCIFLSIIILITIFSVFLGLRNIKQSKQFSYLRMILVNFMSFGGTSFRKSNLTRVNFNRAIIENCDFREANLTHACFFDSKKLHQSRLDNPKYSVLSNQSLRDLLITKNGYGESYVNANLQEVNLKQANLCQADLTGVNFTGATLRGANLKDANLTKIQAIDVDFRGSILTGVCLETWNYDSTTNLDEVVADYVYLKQNQKERLPHDPKKNFAPGEFTKLFQKAIETVDLIFSNGIDWQAFLFSFQKLQIECGTDELAIQAIERKSGGAFVIRVEVPSDANKAEVEKYLKREYEQELESIEDKYLLQLNARNEKIEIYREQIQSIRKDKIDLLDVIKTMAEKDNSKVNMHFNAPVTGATGNVEGDQTIYASEPEETNTQKTETQSEVKNLWTWFVKFLSIGQGTQFVITIVIVVLGLLAGIITVFFSPSDFPFFKPDTEQTIQEQPLN